MRGVSPSSNRPVRRVIKANARKRAEQREVREELEDIRRSQCTVTLLWIGCPPRTAASERYWHPYDALLSQPLVQQFVRDKRFYKLIINYGEPPLLQVERARPREPTASRIAAA